MTTNYDYTKARVSCEQQGLHFVEQLVPHTDSEFTRAHLTQAQVDAVMELHIWALRYLFSPGSYSFWQRIGLAFHFLFGKNL